MDDDELLYREMNEEAPWYMGDDSDNENDYDNDEEEYPRRYSVLLFRNPADNNFSEEDYAKA